jgi:Sugar (and other) transporter
MVNLAEVEGSIPSVNYKVMSKRDHILILAASLGTIFELYDFFLVASLSAEIARIFFSNLDPTMAYIAALLGFASGFVLRPFGALVFGHVGDLVGRKRAFLVTVTLMGICTFTIGLLPGFATIGIAAPALFLMLRLLQGLALGGEFSGAMIYVAEHAPDGSRAQWTSWIMLTGALGLLLSLLVVLPTRYLLGTEAFAAWGWRIPFLLSIVLLAISVWIRLKLHESPVFLRIKAEGALSKSPLAETFGRWANLKLILIALLGIVPGVVVVQYIGQFYTLFFLSKTLKVDDITVNILVISATIITAPLYVIFGWISDRVGRKPVFLTGVLLSACFTVPVFHLLTHYANPLLEATQRVPIVVEADPAQCSVLFNPTGTANSTTSCDIIRTKLTRAGLNYRNEASPPGTMATVKIGQDYIKGYDASTPDIATNAKRFDAQLQEALSRQLRAAGTDRTSTINLPMSFLMLSILLTFGAIAFASACTMLVELFPSRIRYTAMSFPFHLGTAIFGGFLPATAFAIVATTGNPLAGLYYPSAVAAFSFVMVLLFVKESRGSDLHSVRRNE